MFCTAAGVVADAARCEARAFCSISVWMRPAAARNGRSRTRRCTAVFVSPTKPLQNCLSSVNIESSFDRPGHTVSATRAMWMTYTCSSLRIQYGGASMRTVLASMPVSSRSSRVAVCIGVSFCLRHPPKSCHSSFLPRPATHSFVLMRKEPAPVKWACRCVVGVSPCCAIGAAEPARCFTVTGGPASVPLPFSCVGCLCSCVSSARLVGAATSCSRPACLRVACASSWRRCEYVRRR